MRILRSVALLVCCLGSAQAADEEARIVEVHMIWNAAPHNAFTDLVRWRDRWWCVCRSGLSHVSSDGAIQLITSENGEKWSSAAQIKSKGGDLRDPKITVTPKGQLMINAARHQAPALYQSVAYFSDDGRTWSRPAPVGDPDFWLWRVTWHGQRAYGAGYGCSAANKFIRLYASEDGKQYETLVPKLLDEGYPNETAMVFLDDGTCLSLVRRDEGTATAQLGRARPPYKDWSWKDLGVRIGGPSMIRVPDGRLVAGVRLYDGRQRTSLCWVDAEEGRLTEFLPLPSSGDTSYPGLVWHDGLLWVSYYSSHEGGTNVYLAKVRLPERAKRPSEGRPAS